MQLKTLTRLARNRRIPLILGIRSLSHAIYRANFLSAASESGLLKHLVQRPHTLDEIAAIIGCDDDHKEALVDWLSIASLAGALKKTRSGEYALRGKLARSMATDANKDAAAALEEISQLHGVLIHRMPEYLREGKWFNLGEHDAVIAARASRVLEPIMSEAIERAMNRFKPRRYIDVGCGTGIYIRYASGVDPTLTGMGVDLSPEVAECARQRIAEWGLSDRFTIDAGDLRELDPQPEFDLASLINNLCYFETDKRVEVIEQLARFVRPGGGVMLAHPLRAADAGADVVSLYFSGMKDGGPFPVAGEMKQYAEQAGLTDVITHSLAHGMEAVTARVPG